jgi:hypothetical protein
VFRNYNFQSGRVKESKSNIIEEVVDEESKGDVVEESKGEVIKSVVEESKGEVIKSVVEKSKDEVVEKNIVVERIVKENKEGQNKNES